MLFHRTQLLIATVLSSMFIAGSATADGNYRTLKIEYKNHGAYLAEIQPVWETAAGDRYFGDSSSLITTQNNHTVNFSNVKDRNGSGTRPQAGDEIWLRVKIVDDKVELGKSDNESCRKDNTKFYYSDDGGELVVKTGGTTHNDNRCKLVTLPADEYAF